MKSDLSRGVIAGILAATAVALFFLVVDALAGEPFRTPGFLAALVSGGDADAQASMGLVAVYTVIHYALFIAAGVAVASLLGAMGLSPLLGLGLVVGVLFFDVVFYGSLLVRGVDVLEALGWVPFLIGNLIGGLVLMWYLEYTGPEDGMEWRDIFARHQIIREGLIAGLIGAFVVAAWFLLLDVVLREPLFTPAALGSALFDGARGVEQVTISAGNVLGYTALHFAAFFAVGLLAAALATEAERHSVVLLGAVLLFVTFETLFLGLTAIAATWLLDALSWWTILGANLVAAGAMGWYLWHAHPRIGQHLREDVEEDAFAHGDEATMPPPATRAPGA